jgi:hypothetical protein
MSKRDIITAIIVPISILLPIGMFFPKYKYAGRDTKLIFYYLIVAGLTNATAIVLSSYNIRNLPLLHFYTIAETVFFLSYFYTIFNSRTIKKTLTVAAVLLPVLFILNFIFLQSIFQFNTYTRPLEAIVITFSCLTYLYKSGFIEDWLKLPVSWINIGILIYFPTATIIFILSNYFVFVTSNKAMNDVIWDIHSLLVLGMYLAFAKGFAQIKKN